MRRFGSGRTQEEVFSTLYRMNDSRTIDRLCRGAGLDPEVTFRSTPPGYLRFSAVTFMLGGVYERCAERLFPPLRALIWVRRAYRVEAMPQSPAGCQEAMGFS